WRFSQLRFRLKHAVLCPPLLPLRLNLLRLVVPHARLALSALCPLCSFSAHSVLSFSLIFSSYSSPPANAANSQPSPPSSPIPSSACSSPMSSSKTPSPPPVLRHQPIPTTSPRSSGHP